MLVIGERVKSAKQNACLRGSLRLDEVLAD